MGDRHDGPWGRPPSGGGKKPRSNGHNGGDTIQFEEIFRRNQKKFGDMFDGGNGKQGRIIGFILLGLVALWLLSGFYRVQPNQVGVEMLFGKWSNEENLAVDGLHYFWPSPIGEVEILSVTEDRKVTIGYMEVNGAKRDNNIESEMLTGDEKIANVDFVVLWDIKNPGHYLFRVLNPDLAVKRVAESVMREMIGKEPNVFAKARSEMESKVQSQVQALLDKYQTGIRVQQVLLEAVEPPEPVVDAFRDVQRAETDADTARNRALAYRNDILPRAEGQALRIRNEAEAYAGAVVSKAQGDASRFGSVLAAYRQAPDVTSKRLYLETLEEVFSNANKVVLDPSKTGGANPVLPFVLPNNAAQPKGGQQ